VTILGFSTHFCFRVRRPYEADVTDTFLLTFFSWRVSYVTGHWSVTRRSEGQRVVGGLVARPDVGFAWAVWPGRCHFFPFLSAILVCVM